jgi:hypothetical protein
MLKTLCLLALMWIRPEQIDHSLVVFRLIAAQLDFEWSSNGFDSFNVLYTWANASMATENLLVFIFNDSCKWHLFKSFIEFNECTVWIVDVLTKSFGAFITKAEMSVYVFIFMISSKKMNLFRKFKF